MQDKTETQMELEKLYGVFGEAQAEELRSELTTNAAFASMSPARQWKRINDNLARLDYPQKTKEYQMDELLEYEQRFTTGNIYEGKLPDVDMNSLIDLYEEEGDHGF